MMDGNKNLNYFTIGSTDLPTAADAGSHVFNNDDVSIILNGRPWGMASSARARSIKWQNPVCCYS